MILFFKGTTDMKSKTTRELALIAMGAALIAVCSWIAVPTAIPFTLQTFAVCLVTALFGLKTGLAAVALYLLLGAAGLPVFSGFKGGLGALLGTTGTLSSGLYNAALERAGVPYLTPDEEDQAWLMHLIYDVVKATAPMQPEEPAWTALLEKLRARGADYFVLACTELPIVANTLNDPGPFVDPTLELARAAVLACGGKIKD